MGAAAPQRRLTGKVSIVTNQNSRAERMPHRNGSKLVLRRFDRGGEPDQLLRHPHRLGGAEAAGDHNLIVEAGGDRDVRLVGRDGRPPRSHLRARCADRGSSPRWGASALLGQELVDLVQARHGSEAGAGDDGVLGFAVLFEGVAPGGCTPHQLGLPRALEEQRASIRDGSRNRPVSSAASSSRSTSCRAHGRPEAVEAAYVEAARSQRRAVSRPTGPRPRRRASHDLPPRAEAALVRAYGSSRGVVGYGSRYAN